jgi:superfamily II DNA or RNA helicase
MTRATIRFEGGTLLVESPDPSALIQVPGIGAGLVSDPRVGGRLRAAAIEYRRILAALARAGLEVDDQARGYEELCLASSAPRTPYPHQEEALQAWWASKRRGVVVLPTGAGKSYLAELAIARTGRSTLVVAPTIDLMNQWLMLLRRAFGETLVGGIGGGLYELKPLMAATYDSAYLHMDRLGGRFGLVVFDECHHLPGASYAQAAECAIAPFRLGLTATLERADGRHAELERLVGPVVYQKAITDLTGRYLAEYEVSRVGVALTAPERAAYEKARAEYRGFLARHRIALGGPTEWGRFIMLTSRSREGRRAWHAWREQKRLAHQSTAKLEVLGTLLERHRDEQLLVFTSDNDTVYAISRRFLVPAITHQTGTPERTAILEAFNRRELAAVVTSRVLNEGVDLPAASVAIVLSGSSSVREHVQRLGRVLRRQEGKRALLYEVVTEGTGEEHQSIKRRDHQAYRGADGC